VRGIKALDADKPSTPNSEVRYLIAASKAQAKFSLVMDANGSAAVVLKEPLNFDGGDERFLLEVYAKDEGSPSRNASTVVDVRVKRDESRVLKFTSEVYHSQFKEHFPITVSDHGIFFKLILSLFLKCIFYKKKKPLTHRANEYSKKSHSTHRFTHFTITTLSMLRSGIL